MVGLVVVSGVTEIQIVQTRVGAVTEALTLDGNGEVETVSGAGDALFLVQHLPAVNSDHDLIRLFHLAGAGLDPNTLRSKLATDGVMAGYAWGGVCWSPARTRRWWRWTWLAGWRAGISAGEAAPNSGAHPFPFPDRGR